MAPKGPRDLRVALQRRKDGLVARTADGDEVGSEEVELDRLYGLPLNRFTEERNALARRLREAGERARASRIKELPKPSVSAWIVNQLARERELDVRRLVNVGAKLEQSQRAAVEGKDTQDFATTRREEAEVVKRLLEAAREVGAAGGHAPSAAVVQRVGANLRAAAATEQGRELLTRGRLDGDLDPVGFDVLVGVAAPPRGTSRRRSAPEAPPPKQTAPDARALRREREREARLRSAEAEAETLAGKWRRLDRDATQAEQLARRTRRAADDAHKRAERARRRAEGLRGGPAGGAV